MALRVDDVDLVRDRALVERFQLGDPAAFESLYRRYFGRLVRYCQKRVGDPLEAEELAQEAFARALRALPTFDGERRFYPWMTVIANRLCVDSHRRRGRSEPSDVVDLGVIEGGQEKIVDAVDLEILATALGRLGERHREVLDLREKQGWTYQAIADHYDVSLGTVEALLFRARKALKREFMAVVGSDRNWVGIPVLGLLLRRLAGWKARLDAATATLPSLAGPVVAGIVAVTAVTGAIGIGQMVDDARRPEARTTVVHLDTAPAAAPVAGAGAFGEPSTGVAQASPVAAAAPHADPAAPAPGADPDAPPAVLAPPRADTDAVDLVDADRADDPQPVQTEVAGVFVGADPNAVADEAPRNVAGYLNDADQGVNP